VSSEAPDRERPRRPVELVLYVSPSSPACARAQRNIHELIARLGVSNVDLDVRDVSEDAERAEADRILFTPTLVVRRPLLTWIVGDLTNGEDVLRVLQSVETEEEP
jgi:KaiB-like protein